jgi:signal transduction histidine kinase
VSAALGPETTASQLELGDVAAQLTSISESLLSSYARLAEHAERVEKDLVASNAELARRVEEVESLRSHLDAVLRALPCGVLVLRADGSVASANPSACALLGVAEDTLLHAPLPLALEPERADGSVREHVRPDGAVRSLSVRRSPVATRGGRGWVVIVDDRTAERRLAGELAARSKMAALGTMAGGIAHEVRNPLNAVRGFAELLRLELDGGSRAHRFASRICQGVDEVDGIVTSLLGFAASGKLTRAPIEPRELVDEAVESARSEPCAAERPERWTVRARVACPRFQGDRIKLRQALRNLVANAIQAQPTGGHVVVDVSLTQATIELRVHDAGPGLPAALRGRVGEPFLTTRAAGTGLGLALVHAIADVHGGRFEIRAEPGPLGGADARIQIPFQPCP